MKAMANTSHSTPKIHALVVAAGVGSRYGDTLPKQYQKVCGKTILEHSINALASSQWIEDCTVVVAASDEIAPILSFDLPVRMVVGGKERVDSVTNGVEKIALTAHLDDIVLIHDAARPCLLTADLDRLINAALCEPYGAILAVPVADTLKVQAMDNTYVAHTISRKGVWQAQTPQAYRLRHLLSALSYLKKNNRKLRKSRLGLSKSSKQPYQEQENALASSEMTDEAMVFECLDYPIALVQGSPSNIKLTYASDLWLIEAILSHRQTLTKPE